MLIFKFNEVSNTKREEDNFHAAENDYRAALISRTKDRK